MSASMMFLLAGAFVGVLSAIVALLRGRSSLTQLVSCACAGPPSAVFAFYAYYLSLGPGRDRTAAALVFALAVAYLLHPYAVHRLVRPRWRPAAHAASVALSYFIVRALWPPNLPP
jgi:hypothetical protein